MVPKNRIRFVLIACSLALLPLASANAAGEAGSHWSSIVDRVLGNGVTRVGDFNVSQFRAQASRIQWGTFQGTPDSVVSGSRQSAYYFRCRQKVSLSSDVASASAESQAELELHEALNAACYNDNDYSLTTALVTLASANGRAERDHLLQSYNRIFRKTIHVAMGGTGVSGGGDLSTLTVKQEVLRLIQAGNFGTMSREFLSTYPLIQFEPLRSERSSGVILNYQSYRAGNEAGRKETFSVWVPMSRWNAGGAEREALVQEIALKITGVFPARDGATRSFHPNGCPANVIATYPATNDPVVANIQQRRAQTQHACRKPFPGDTSEAIVTSDRTMEETPRTPGTFVFECQFRWGQDHADYELRAAAGGSSLNAEGWAVNERPAMGWSRVSRQGQLEFVMLEIRGTDGRQVRSAPARAANGAATATLEVDGQTLTYTCQASR